MADAPSVIHLDGAQGEGGGQIIRAALSLSAATGQAFHITRIRAGRVRPGLQPQHLAAVRAVAMLCGADVGGAFDGSPDVRFEPGPVRAGEFRFEIATAGALTLLLQTVIPPLATVAEASRVEVTGGTHVPRSPAFQYLARHWAPVVAGLGLRVRLDLVRAGFYPPGGGEARAEVQPWTRPARLLLERRGELVAIQGVAGAARLPGVAERLGAAARERLWEARRLESTWEIVEMPAPSKGCFVLIEAVFEEGRAAFSLLGERRVRRRRGRRRSTPRRSARGPPRALGRGRTRHHDRGDEPPGDGCGRRLAIRDTRAHLGPPRRRRRRRGRRAC
ncbi:MAG: RNA 3'-phosphate cyclase [Acidobacteria bacterium]|nr:MAG: RNA 3'-phosphate cyclase [Acidobacteriota bacterium]